MLARKMSPLGRLQNRGTVPAIKDSCEVAVAPRSEVSWKSVSTLSWEVPASRLGVFSGPAVTN